MAKATSAQVRRARKAAAITTLVVAVFAAGFIGLVTAINQMAPLSPAIANSEFAGEGDGGQAMPTDPLYVLLIGSDTRKGTALYTGKSSDHAQVDQHSDVMTLVRVDPKTHAIGLLSIPRDTVIAGQTLRINEALLRNDPGEVVDAVEELTGLRPDYYMMVTFASFDHLVDDLGGIDVDVPKTIKVSNPETGGNITVKAGQNRHLNGAQTLALARARREYDDNQDAVRQSNVRAIEQAIISKALSGGDGLTPELLVDLAEADIKTDMDLSLLCALVADFMEHADEVTFVSGTGPYADGGERATDGQWVIEEDTRAWRKVMRIFKRGGDPATVVALP